MFIAVGWSLDQEFYSLPAWEVGRYYIEPIGKCEIVSKQRVFLRIVEGS